MIKLKDILLLELAKYQVFLPFGMTGLNAKFSMDRMPTGKLRIRNPEKEWFNKPNGAFWTSSYNKNIQSSDWAKFIKGNVFNKQAGYAMIFKVKGAKIYTIKNSKDYKRLEKDFSLRKNQFDWEKISKKYDAVHISNPEAHRGLTSFDVESTVWFNMRPLKVVGTIKV